MHVKYTYLGTFHCRVFHHGFQGKTRSSSAVRPVRSLQSRPRSSPLRTETRPPLFPSARLAPRWPKGAEARPGAGRAGGGRGRRAERAAPRRAPGAFAGRAGGLLREPGLLFVHSESSWPPLQALHRSRPRGGKADLTQSRWGLSGSCGLCALCFPFAMRMYFWRGRLVHRGMSDTRERNRMQAETIALSLWVCVFAYQRVWVSSLSDFRAEECNENLN